MTVPRDKEALLGLIDASFEKLTAALASVPEGLAREHSMEGHAKGTRMSACDLVAYLVGWNELGGLAQKFYRDHDGLAFPQLRERLDAAKGSIVAAVASRDNAALYERPWYGKWTMGRMIQFNTASPYANAHGRLRKWLKAKGLPRRA